jgi:DNA polymerase-1
MDTLLLVDALNLIRRVYEANPAPDSAAKFVVAKGAILGSLTRALREHPADKLIAAFDVEGETWRHRLHPGYKATRKPMPAALRAGLPELKEAFSQAGLDVVAEPDVDADDVLASLAVQALAKYPAVKVKILTTDKDMLQLLPYGVMVYDHFARAERTPAWVEAKFGVKPAVFRDFQALMGDQADGIPGMAGVGKKTASEWLLRFGSVSAMLEQLEGLDPKLQAKLKAGLSDLELSLQLVTLRRTLIVPI